MEKQFSIIDLSKLVQKKFGCNGALLNDGSWAEEKDNLHNLAFKDESHEFDEDADCNFVELIFEDLDEPGSFYRVKLSAGGSSSDPARFDGQEAGNETAICTKVFPSEAKAIIWTAL